MGLSQTMGDSRQDLRVKGLVTLLGIINQHFFPPRGNAKVDETDAFDSNAVPQQGDLQTLQLIFRGILVPSLEYEEMDGNSTSGSAPELLPTKFVHFLSMPPSVNAPQQVDERQRWIGTTFDHLIDGCISICLRSMETFHSDSLVEEVLAMLNSCLLSDSGHLAVMGLRRLQQFVTKDLELKDVSDDTWATVSHMLFRVMTVRGLPPSTTSDSQGSSDGSEEQQKQEHDEQMDEFIREQQLLSNRRYIGCNAAMVIGSLLTNEAIAKSIGVHWYLFLTSALGKGIRDWEKVANIMGSKIPQESASPDAQHSPPDYLENALYARKWVTRFLITIISHKDTYGAEAESADKVLQEETESMLQAFLERESSGKSSSIEMRNISKLVSDLLDGFGTLGDEQLAEMKWVSSILSSCIQTNNVTIRSSVQVLLTRMLKMANPSPAAEGSAKSIGRVGTSTPKDTLSEKP